MPYFDSSQEWLEQSTLLLQARPSTTRVTTRYTPAPRNRRIRLRLRNAASRAASQAAAATESQPKGEDPSKSQPGTESVQPEVEPPSSGPAELVMKTYDPVSGTCLKYRTQKAAEVGRLVAALGTLGREMAGVASARAGEDVAMTEAGVDDVDDAVVEDVPASTAEVPTSSAGGDNVASEGGAKGHQRAKKSVSFAEESPAPQTKAPEKKAGGGAGSSGGGGAGGGGGGGKKKKKGKGK